MNFSGTTIAREMTREGMENDGPIRRSCPRTLDRPILVFGLEPEDLVVVGLIAGGLLFIADPLIAVGTGFALWTGLLKLKAGKPPGYLFTLAYRVGLLRLLPPSMRPPQLLPRAETLRIQAFDGGDHDDA